ncbi:GH92 family glycosyl hydrolase, partial [Phyllobacterium sp. 0TCS1.6C]|nr:GH92 family glycosyl hydrolase [Phyllobacterium sp. 0TCS1.6C]
TAKVEPASPELQTPNVVASLPAVPGVEAEASKIPAIVDTERPAPPPAPGAEAEAPASKPTLVSTAVAIEPAAPKAEAPDITTLPPLPVTPNADKGTAKVEPASPELQTPDVTVSLPAVAGAEDEAPKIPAIVDTERPAPAPGAEAEAPASTPTLVPTAVAIEPSPAPQAPDIAAVAPPPTVPNVEAELPKTSSGFPIEEPSAPTANSKPEPAEIFPVIEPAASVPMPEMGSGLPLPPVAKKPPSIGEYLPIQEDPDKRGVSTRVRVTASGMKLSRQIAGGVYLETDANTLGAKPADYVNTMRGAHSAAYIADGVSRGNTFPAMALPFGFNMWTPVNRLQKKVINGWRDTKLNRGYYGNDFFYTFYENEDDTGLLDKIYAFAVVHAPSPWIGNRQTLQIMPVSSIDTAVEPITEQEARGAKFDRATEISLAHYYSVDFKDGTRTEMTPTDHAVYFRFTPSRNQNQNLAIVIDKFFDTSGSIEITKDGTISGFTDHGSPRMYYYGEFDIAPIITSGNALPAWLRFDTAANREIGLRLATSFISVEQAKDNLSQEIGAKTFDQILQSAMDAWNAKLGLVEVEGATGDQKTILYSNLYRSFLYPNSAFENVKSGNDLKAYYMSPYIDVPTVKPGKIWVNNGFWDTYRTNWPLYALLLPKQTGEMIDGFVNGYKDGGWVTRWSGPGYKDMMVATSSDIIFADAYMKNIRNFDITAAYDSMVKNATVFSGNPERGRKGMDKTPFYGYSLEGTEAVSWSLEAYLNDFGLAQMARARGNKDDAAYFANNAIGFARIFDGESSGLWSGGWFRAKDSAGKWRNTNRTPQSWYEQYTEGNAWHYSMLAPQDGRGLANLYGGKAKLRTKLDALFAMSPLKDGGFNRKKPEIKSAYEIGKDHELGEYQHSNQPVHHVLYMYNHAGYPAGGQKHLRDVMDKLYSSGFDAMGNSTGDGYMGDEDNGEMSAWYVFSAMGIYPLGVGRPEYTIGAPYFPKMVVKVTDSSGKPQTITIKAPKVSSSNRFVFGVKLNGEPINRTHLSHDELISGAMLEFDMVPYPTKWGTGEDAAPASITQGADKPQPWSSLLPGGRYTLRTSDSGEDHLFDRDSQTIWSSAESKAAVVEFERKVADTVHLYTLTSSKTLASAPTSWTLKGSNDGKDWIELDKRTDVKFTWPQQTKPFVLEKPETYTSYRFTFVGSDVTIAELELLGREAAAQ